ncbi:MAG TPA: ABC transporter substrate-binding protein [Candidatus Limnocylindrales bacterium]|nr:ABC transporter substrate-binding protein [Candidatus Limnocylindrales bacterium]
MRRPQGRVLRLLASVGLLVVAIAAVTSASSAAPSGAVRVAIMSDCKGAFGFAQELGIGGAQTAFAQFAGGKVKNKNKPSAGMTGIKAGGKTVNIVGYGCGDDTPATALRETRRLMQQLRADVLVGPLSGDEAVAIANWAKPRPSKTVIIGTAGSQDPTLQIAPKNVFRYHGDGAQWNAGIGEIVYKKLGWRKAAIIMDDYSFGWTSAAGIIADFCAIGGQITKRVFPPLNTTDYSSYVRQLPQPSQVDGYFWVVGGTGTGPALKAFEQAYGPIDAKKHSGNLFLWFLTGKDDVAPRMIGAYVGGFGTAPGLKGVTALNQYHAFVAKTYPKMPADDGFFYNYYQGTRALIEGLKKSGGAVGARLQAALPRSIFAPMELSDGGRVKLDANRQAIQDQWPVQIVRGPDGGPAVTLTGYVPNVNQTFGGLFTKSSPPPGRTQPPCVKKKLPWQGKIREVKNGVVTKTVIK